MSTDFRDIRAAIKQKIDDSATKIAKTYAYERSTFEGFPAAIIAPSENQADYGSNVTDKITFIFKIRVYDAISKESDHQREETTLEGAVDELLTIFRERGVLGSACDWVEPAPGAWYYEERGEGVYRAFEITLKCRKYVG